MVIHFRSLTDISSVLLCNDQTSTHNPSIKTKSVVCFYLFCQLGFDYKGINEQMRFAVHSMVGCSNGTQGTLSRLPLRSITMEETPDSNPLPSVEGSIVQHSDY